MSLVTILPPLERSLLTECPCCDGKGSWVERCEDDRSGMNVECWLCGGAGSCDEGAAAMYEFEIELKRWECGFTAIKPRRPQ